MGEEELQSPNLFKTFNSFWVSRRGSVATINTTKRKKEMLLKVKKRAKKREKIKIKTHRIHGEGEEHVGHTLDLW